MDKKTFISKFELAAKKCLEFNRRINTVKLSEQVRFNFEISRHYEITKEGLIKFIGGRLLRPEEFRGLEGKRAANFLWVDGKIPVWIDLQVESFDENFTYILIRFNPARLTKDHSILYYNDDNPPFQILGNFF